MSSRPRYLLLADDRLLCDAEGRLRLLEESELAPWGDRLGERDPLGCYRARPLVAQHLAHGAEPDEGEHWEGLRSQLGRVDETLFSLAGNALQWRRWRADHRYCGRCGNPTHRLPGQPAYGCERCGLRFYPRLSPCMIALVVRGDYCLLARHNRAGRPLHTALAGFVEIGEPVEQTVHREVHEEVGLSIHSPRYFASQPWPFPGQLMLGFHADYREGDIRVDGDEILEADWWHYEQLPPTPPEPTLAGRLIAHFVAQRRHNKGSNKGS